MTFKPDEEVTPDDAQETYLGKTRSKTKAQENVNRFIKRHYANPVILRKQISEKPKPDPYDQLLVSVNALKNLSIQDSSTQNRIKNLLINTLEDAQDQGKYIKQFMERPHFPIKFAQNPKSIAKWQIRWHKDAISRVRLAYDVFQGSVNPANRLYNPKLRGLLQMFDRCLVCRLTDKEWKHPKGIIITGSQVGECSAKIADTIIPQTASNVIHLSETFSLEAKSIKVMRKNPSATLPRKGTTGSAAYDLYPAQPSTIRPNQRVSILTGLQAEIPVGFYGQIMPRSGMSLNDRIDVIPGVLDADY